MNNEKKFFDVPFFSILVPTYNQTEYLRDALDSLIKQTFENWEALVVDDGSTDETFEILKEYAAKDSRFRIFRKENGGTGSALNEGLRHARGEWICWLSTDDLFVENKLEVHKEAIELYPDKKFFYSNYYVLDDDKKELIAPETSQTQYFLPPFQVMGFVLNNYINGLSIAIKREVFNELGPFDETIRYGQDYDMWLRIVSKYPAQYVDAITIVTRIYPSQVTSANPELGILDSTRALINFINKHKFEDFFPHLDLTKFEHIAYAIDQTLNVSLNLDAFIYKGVNSTALLERFKEWLYTLPAEYKPHLKQYLKFYFENAERMGILKNFPQKIVRCFKTLHEAIDNKTLYKPHNFLKEIIEIAERNCPKGTENEICAKLVNYINKVKEQFQKLIDVERILPQSGTTSEKPLEISDAEEAELLSVNFRIMKKESELVYVIKTDENKYGTITKKHALTDKLTPLVFDDPFSKKKKYIDVNTILKTWQRDYNFEKSLSSLEEKLNNGEKISIAFTIVTPSVKGGGTANVFAYADMISELGYDVTIYANEEKPSWTASKCKFIYKEDIKERYSGITEDIVIFFSIMELPALYAYCKNKKTVFLHFCQGVEIFHYGMHNVKILREDKPYFHLLHNLPVARITVSPSLSRYFLRNYNQKTFLIRNGINDEYFKREVSSERNYKSDEIILLFVGNPDFFLKGFETFTKAVVKLVKEMPDKKIKVRILDGNSEDKPHEEIIENVSITVKNCYDVRCMINEYKKAHIYINSSYYEGFGLPSLEAMATGLPVIQTENSGLDGIAQDGENCLLVPVGDVDKLFESIVKIINDESLRTKIIEGGKKTAINFTKFGQRMDFFKNFGNFFAMAENFSLLKQNGKQEKTEPELKKKEQTQAAKAQQKNERKKRILFVVHNFVKDWKAGVENYTYSMALQLRKKNYEVAFLYPGNVSPQESSLSHEIYEGFDVYRISVSNNIPLMNEIQDKQIGKVFSEFLASRDFDIVHFHHFMGFPLSLAEIVKEQNRKLFITLHDYWLTCPRVHLYVEETNSVCNKKPSPLTCAKCILNGNSSSDEFSFLFTFLKKRQERLVRIFNSADLITAPSEFVKRKFSHVGTYRDIRVMPLGLTFPKSDSSVERKKENIIFGYIGSIAPVKNVGMLVEAFAESKGGKLKIFGNGAKSEINSISEKIKSNDKIEYKGAYHPDDLPKVLAEIDVVIVPSFIETFSFTVREALLANKFVIASNVGGIPEVINREQNGILFTPYEKKSLTEAINSAVENPELVFSHERFFDKILSIEKDAEIWTEIYKEEKKHPKVSIIIPVFNKVEYTKNCINSVYEKTRYPNFEVIVVDNGSTDGTKEFLAEEKKKRDNLKVITNERNSGFAKANNLASEIAEGEFLHFLNNDTLVNEFWLCTLVYVLENDDDVAAVGSKLLYPDGSLQHMGVLVTRKSGELYPTHFLYEFPNRAEALSKPWLFQSLTAASLLVRKEKFIDVGKFNEKFWNGYEDVDLCFRLYASGGRLVLQPKSEVIHFESQSGDERFAKVEENKKLLSELWADKINPNIEWLDDNRQIKKNYNTVIPYFPKNNENNSASIIIVTYNSSETITACLTSVLATVRANDEIIIVDNASSDNTVQIVESFASQNGKIKLVRNTENLGFSKGCNIGIKISKNPYVVLLNPDTVVYNNWLEKLTFHFGDPFVAAVGPVSNYAAGMQNFAWYLDENNIGALEKIDNELEKNHLHGRLEAKLLIGFCLILKRNILNEIGYLDENLFLGNDDLEISWRLRLAGYKLIISPDTFVAHLGQKSFESLSEDKREDLVRESTEALYKKLTEVYGKYNVPTPDNLWGMSWFKPVNPVYNVNSNLIDVKEKYKKIFHVHVSQKTVSVIVPVYNKSKYTVKFLSSIKYNDEYSLEIIVIDNNSTDNTGEILSNFRMVNENAIVITNNENLGFPKAVNQGLKIAKGDFIFIANNDIILPSDWLERMIAHANKSDEIGIVGPVSNEVSGVQKVKSVGYSNLYDELTEYMEAVARKNNGQFFEFPRVAFLFTLIKRKVLEEIGGLDERFTPGNYEDDDYCLRAQLAGFKTIIALDVFVHHFGSVSFTAEGKEKYSQVLKTNEAKFIEKWGYSPDEIWLKKKTPKENELYIPIENENFPALVEEANRKINEGNLSEARDLLQKAVRNFDDRFGISYEKLEELLNKIELALAEKK